MSGLRRKEKWESSMSDVTSNGNAGDTGSLGPPDLMTNNIDPGIYRNNGKAANGASQVTIATEDTEDSRKQMFGKDENEERGNWTGRFDFLLSMLGYAVGLGNVWRFPYLCYRNGGGAFLIPFILMMILIGVPLFFMEASLGQFCSSGPLTCWKFAPLFKGVGISMVAVSALTSLYYNMILAWSYYYFFASFTSDLPWIKCENNWNTRDCSTKLPLTECTTGQKYTNGTCYDGDTFVGLWDAKKFTNATGRKRKLASEEYWEKVALDQSSGIEEFGQPKWDLVLCLMFAWFICFLCLIKGIKSTGKVVYFTAIFPYVVLLILFFNGVFLSNAGEGIYYYIVPDFERLLDPRVWKDAAVQIFFSMSIAGGGLVTLSSYNRFHNNILKDSIIVSVGDTLTCIFAGFVIFSYLGHMAGELNAKVGDVAQDGAGLAFVVYPTAVASLPASPFWSALFFFMLITLGLDSQFAMLETVLTGVMDQYPVLRPHKTLVILVICIVFFIIGLPLCCPGGVYLLQILDNYVGGWTLLIIGFAECICITYIYGVNRFIKDIELMLGLKMFIWWKICWMILSPIALVLIFIATFIDYEASTYGDYTFPAWADGLGWFMAVAIIAAIPITMLYQINREDEDTSIWEKIKLQCTPSREWGPALVRHRELVNYIDGWVDDPWAEKGAFVNYAYKSDSEIRTGSLKSLEASRLSARMKKSLSDSNGSTKTGISFESYV
ncbi:sodium-dependent proline transporter-like [Saccostrea cucullata]|uniref:sodium-dependent proline transporter-like n=1 Tax=Saccostrea cuccullata TaxID=36930 RepID=UPI002ED42904